MQRLHLTRQAQCDIAQRQVDRRAGGLAFGHVDPGAQRAATFMQLERQIDVAAQQRDVDVRQLGMQGTAPAAPVAGTVDQRLVHARAQREAFTPGQLRRSVDAQIVVAQAVAHHDHGIGQQQRCGAALFVDPGERGAADHELVLPEEPVGGRMALAIAADLAGHLETPDADVALGVAPHHQLRVVDQQLLEPQLQRQQRRHRQRRHHAR